MRLVIIHESHEIQKTSYSTECLNCWGCTCHFLDALEKPCDRSVAIESNNVQVIQSVERQSALYGEQISNLENSGLIEDANRIQWAWDAFRRQLSGTYFLRIARTAYSNAYWNTHDYLRQVGDPI